MSFHFEIDPREHFVGRAISRARESLRRAFLEVKAERHLTQAEIARSLGIDRSAVNRQLTGEANMTVRSLAELAWVLGRELRIEMPKAVLEAGENEGLVVHEGGADLTSGTTIAKSSTLAARVREQTGSKRPVALVAAE